MQNTLGVSPTLRRRSAESDLALPASLPQVLRRVYARRSLKSASDLDLGLGALHKPRLRGLSDAVALLELAIKTSQRLLVIGDFDADGATSCALAVRALKALGAQHVDYMVPNRFEFGYGLTPEIVEVAAERAPDVLITVDNGISSGAGVKRANEKGIRVLITDHHLPGPELPEAAAIVNPNQQGCDFPSKNLAGVGVIFYVMLALRARLRAEGIFQALGIVEPNLACLLDLVAVGTVADVVTLDHNNRILVEQGLRRIRRGAGAVGIEALARVAGREVSVLSSADIAYAVAPRLNAAGRLKDMSIGIECLLSDERDRATAIAWELDQINAERRHIESEMHSHAVALLATLDFAGRGLPHGLCLYDPSWHQGVIGILASRIKERLHRPTIAFAPAGGGELKGSARSVPGLHIRDVIEAVATRHPGLVSRFGGHAMAAGLSLPVGSLELFTSAFDDEARRCLAKEALDQILQSDGELSEEELCLENAELLRLAGPWGAGFPEPLFDGEFEIVDSRVVGGRHLRMTVRPSRGERVLQSIWFNVPEERVQTTNATVRLAYRLDVNEYRGTRALQLVVVHVEEI